MLWPRFSRAISFSTSFALPAKNILANTSDGWQRRNPRAAGRVGQRAATLDRRQREERETGGVADVLCRRVVERDRIAESTGRRVLRTGEEASFRSVIAANVGMRDPREYGEMILQIAEDLQILARLVIRAGFLRKNDGP